MAFPDNAALIDSFNRADGALYAGGGAGIWSTGGINSGTNGLNVSSNAAAVGGGLNARDLGTYGPSFDIFATVSALPGAGSYSFLCWVDSGEGGSWNGYGLIVIAGSPNDTWQIRRYDAGSNAATITNTASAAIGAGDKIGLSRRGSVLTAHKFAGGAWSQVSSGLDATYSGTGPFGVEIGDAAGRIDDFSGGTVEVPWVSVTAAGGGAGRVGSLA